MSKIWVHEGKTWVPEGNLEEAKERIAALEAECRRREIAEAEAMALVLSHEGHIATLEVETKRLGEWRASTEHLSIAESWAKLHGIEIEQEQRDE